MFKTNVATTLDGLIDRCINMRVAVPDVYATLKVVFPHMKLAGVVERRIKRVSAYREQLERLRMLPVVEQKSAAWYEIRQNLITASDFAQALGEGKFGNQKQFFQKKCGYDDVPFNSELPPLKWGNMFEQVAQEIYALRNGCTIHEFGILQHPVISHLGASPDGITSDGVLLEIKCPWRRKINGEIPKQYYYQIQGQLDVCDLDECDYFECEFEEGIDGFPCQESEVSEVSEESEEVAEVAGLSEEVAGFEPSGFERGAIIEDLTLTDQSRYTYSEIRHDWTDEAVQAWVETILGDAEDREKYKVHYYVLQASLTMRVYRDKDFIKEKLDQLSEVWDKIIEYRRDADLYKSEIQTTKRASTAKAKTLASAASKLLNTSECLL